MQKTLLIGYLGKDPEMKYTAGGTAIATFTIASRTDGTSSPCATPAMPACGRHIGSRESRRQSYLPPAGRAETLLKYFSNHATIRCAASI